MNSRCRCDGVDPPDTGVVATDVDTVVVMSFVDSHGSTGDGAETWTDELTVTLTMARHVGRGEGLDAWLVDRMESVNTDTTDADPERDAVTTVVWDLTDTLLTLSGRRLDTWVEEMQSKTVAGLHDRWTGARPGVDENFYSRGLARGIAVERLRPRRASVLVFATGVQGHTDADGQPLSADETTWEARLHFTMRKVDGRWLMSDMDYVTQPDAPAHPLV